MNLYADTSALIAWFHPADKFAPAVTSWCRERTPEFCWNPLLRIELRHNLRRLSGNYAAVAWHAYRASETSIRLRLGSHRLPLPVPFQSLQPITRWHSHLPKFGSRVQDRVL